MVTNRSHLSRRPSHGTHGTHGTRGARHRHRQSHLRRGAPHARGKRYHRQFPNGTPGFQALLVWLEQRCPRAPQEKAAGGSGPACHACLEATGTYGEALATFLHAQGLPISVVNPKRIAHFAKSRLSRAKTDKGDAGLIAAFCQQERPGLWSPPPAAYRQLQALLRHRQALEGLQQQERNRLGAADHPAAVRTSLEAHLAHLAMQLATQLATLEQGVRDHLAAHPELNRQRQLLRSIPGIGETTARWLLAELAGMPRFQHARQVAAVAGLDPRVQETGQWKGRTRLSKQGNGFLRRALYLPALPAVTALRHNPVLQAFAARLRARGKCGMAVVGAVMRKLLHLAFRVLHHGKAFDPEWGTAAAG